MNAKHFAAAAVAASCALLSTASFAQSHPGDLYGYDLAVQKVESTKTRAQVQAELAQARAKGELRTDADGYGYLQQRATASTRTREEVRAETIEAMKHGSLSQGNASIYSRG